MTAPGPELACESCKATEGVEVEPARTGYTAEPMTLWDHLLEREPKDPNPPVMLCRPCAKDYHDHWDDMWRTYYQNLL